MSARNAMVEAIDVLGLTEGECNKCTHIFGSKEMDSWLSHSRARRQIALRDIMNINADGDPWNPNLLTLLPTERGSHAQEIKAMAYGLFRLDCKIPTIKCVNDLAYGNVVPFGMYDARSNTIKMQICPDRKIDGYLSTLAHEMAHAYYNCQAKSDPNYKLNLRIIDGPLQGYIDWEDFARDEIRARIAQGVITPTTPKAVGMETTKESFRHILSKGDPEPQDYALRLANVIQALEFVYDDEVKLNPMNHKSRPGEFASTPFLDALYGKGKY